MLQYLRFVHVLCDAEWSIESTEVQFPGIHTGCTGLTQQGIMKCSGPILNHTRVAWLFRLSHQGCSPEGWEKLPLAVRVVLALLLLALVDHVLPAQFIGREVLRAFLAVGLVELEALERRDAELLARVRRLFH